MTLIYNPRLAIVKIDPHAKNQGHRSNGSNRRAPTVKRTDTHTHRDATKRIIDPVMRSINITSSIKRPVLDHFYFWHAHFCDVTYPRILNN